MVGNSAVSGVTSDYREKREFTPTVVTIMLGMNDVIHQDWSFTPDLSAKKERYRRDITEKVRQYKKLGAEVMEGSAIVDLPELGGSAKLRAAGLPLFTLVDFEGA